LAHTSCYCASRKISPELGKRISTSGDIIGRYERDAMMPFIEVIIKIADVLDISIDFLVDKTNLVLDQATLKRLEDINALAPDAKLISLNIST